MAPLPTPPGSRHPEPAPRRLRAAARRTVLLALALLASACGAGDEAAGDRAGVLDDDPRYRIVFEAQPPAGPDATGELRLAVLPGADWHLAPDAPVRLDLEDGDGVAFEAAQRDDAAGPGDGTLAFTSRFRCAGSGDVVARGRVRFGMCQGDSVRCVIVDRDLALPLAIGPPP